MKVEIWFEFASTYSYLTVCRAPALLEEAGVDFLWRPFLLGPIFRDRGMETSPFVTDGLRGAYMWRDMERRAAHFGLPFARPGTFPANGLQAARVMTAALQEPWCGAFARDVFAAQFARGQDISDVAVLREVLAGQGGDADHWLARSQQDDTKAALRQATDRARELGIFGAPSFVVGDDMFWDDDRLEDAIGWAQGTPH
ncbi:2-hydroxychromene-2-carboxylate isomerase [Marimonas sp. MJW-29]|uniref:2-hydroxychromene-2-carboxylate isomerase n=1 Tax=Sulfitobacter sediminis TaxID=3234186 RepID=A0ABV3RQD5_9RHOB